MIGITGYNISTPFVVSLSDMATYIRLYDASIYKNEALLKAFTVELLEMGEVEDNFKPWDSIERLMSRYVNSTYIYPVDLEKAITEAIKSERSIAKNGPSCNVCISTEKNKFYFEIIGQGSYKKHMPVYIPELLHMFVYSYILPKRTVVWSTKMRNDIINTYKEQYEIRYKGKSRSSDLLTVFDRCADSLKMIDPKEPIIDYLLTIAKVGDFLLIPKPSNRLILNTINTYLEKSIYIAYIEL